MPSSHLKGLRLTGITIPSWVTKEELPDYIKLTIHPRFHGADIEKLLADPGLKITTIEQERPEGGITRLREMKPPQSAPSFTKQAWNFTVAMAQFAVGGFKTVTEEEYKERITRCDVCPRRSNWRCLGCGCILIAKARIRDSICDDGNWPVLCQVNRPPKTPKTPKTPKMPSVLNEAWNLVTSIAQFIVQPGFVTKAQYEERLKICDTCDSRVGSRCSLCGCFLAAKAVGRAWTCDKWPNQWPPCTLRLNTICNNPGCPHFAEEITPDVCDKCKERKCG